MNRKRPIVTAESKPHFPKHARLQFDPLRRSFAVLAPERVFWPDEVAVDILKLCDGNRTVAAIAEHLAGEYEAPTRYNRSGHLGVRAIMDRYSLTEFVEETAGIWQGRRLGCLRS